MFPFFVFTLLNKLSPQPFPLYECAEIQVFKKTHMYTCIANQIANTDNRKSTAIQIQQTAFNHKIYNLINRINDLRYQHYKKANHSYK